MNDQIGVMFNIFTLQPRDFKMEVLSIKSQEGVDYAIFIMAEGGC